MRGKFWISILALGSILGASIKYHVSSWISKEITDVKDRRKIFFKSASESFDESKIKSKRGEKLLNSSLDKNHLGVMQYESEGSHSPIFLVNKDNYVIKIEPSLHGQKRRYMYDGITIDKHDTWFGPRTNGLDQLNIDSLKNIKFYKDFLRKLDIGELKTFQEWWDKKPEEQKCEAIEIIYDCQEIKKMLNGNVEDKLNKLLKIDLLKISALHESDNNKIPKLKEIIGADKLINFPKIHNNIGNLMGGSIDKWLEDFLVNSEKSKEGSNPFYFMEKLANGENAYNDCSKLNGKNNEIYRECNENIKETKDYQLKENETFSIVKVDEVVKSGILNGTVQLAKNLEKKQNENDLRDQEVINDWIYNSARSDNLIDLECSYLWYKLWKIKIMFSGESKGCEMIWNFIFSGEPQDKRWCLFQVEGMNKYIREYEFKFLSSFNWYDKDKFWARCSSYKI